MPYLRIDIGLAPAETTGITLEVLRRNEHLLAEGDDYWIGQRMSRGLRAVGDKG